MELASLSMHGHPNPVAIQPSSRDAVPFLEPHPAVVRTSNPGRLVQERTHSSKGGCRSTAVRPRSTKDSMSRPDMTPSVNDPLEHPSVPALGK
jgi:hypothetical protein